MTQPDANERALGLIGPTAEDDIRRAIERYGPDAVKDAVKKLAKVRRGPKLKPDWNELSEFLDPEVGEWLEGGDPFTRSDYSISQAFAEAHPGQSRSSTATRILRKLKTKNSRKVYVLSHAWERSRGAYSYKTHLRTLKELSEINAKGPWSRFLRAAESFVADYSAKFGHPAESLCMEEIEEGAVRPLSPLYTGLLAHASKQGTPKQ